MPTDTAEADVPDTHATAEPLRSTKPRQSVRKRVPSQRALAADTISVASDNTIDNSEGEPIEDQHEPGQAPDPGTAKRAGAGPKDKDSRAKRVRYAVHGHVQERGPEGNRTVESADHVSAR